MTVLLDGAIGTELTRRGIDTSLPLWSAIALDAAPDVVRAIHVDYLRAGAQVITTNTFRTNLRALARAGIAGRARELTFRAVDLARDAIAESGVDRAAVRIAGSIAPVEDCYAPDLVPSDAELAREHAALARNLAEAGVDLMLVETQNTVREAVAAAGAATATGRPLWVSFTLDAHDCVLSGEALPDAVAAVLPFEPEAILVNCIPVAQIDSALRALRAAVPRAVAVGAYGNVGHVDAAMGWTLTNAVSPEAYAAAARGWRALGAEIIGGCCGTAPEHIRALERV